MSGMRYDNTKNLIVTRYSLLLGLERLLCFRSASVLPSFCLRFRFAPIDGPSTDLQRIYNGTTWEGVESSRRISLKPIFRLGDGFGMLFAFYIVFRRFSSMVNKANQPEINAYCYVVETASPPLGNT